MRSLDVIDRTLKAEFHGEDEDFAALLMNLIQAGVSVANFAEEELSLEEVFMMITKGHVN